jgi:hypothetical protein
VCLMVLIIWHFKKEADLAKDALQKSVIHDSERVSLLRKDTRRMDSRRQSLIQHSFPEEDIGDDVWEDDLNRTHVQSSYYMNPHITRQQRYVRRGVRQLIYVL